MILVFFCDYYHIIRSIMTVQSLPGWITSLYGFYWMYNKQSWDKTVQRTTEGAIPKTLFFLNTGWKFELSNVGSRNANNVVGMDVKNKSSSTAGSATLPHTKHETSRRKKCPCFLPQTNNGFHCEGLWQTLAVRGDIKTVWTVGHVPSPLTATYNFFPPSE